MSCVQGKPDPTAAPQSNGRFEGTSQHQGAETLPNGHQQAVPTPQFGEAVEGTPDSHQQLNGSPEQVGNSIEGHHQQSSCQPSSHQASAAEDDPQGQAPDWDFASRRGPGHPQSQEPSSPNTEGHPQRQSGASTQRLSISRRRSMERPSASLTLPFEQLNFVFHHINYSVPATVGCSSTYLLHAIELA